MKTVMLIGLLLIFGANAFSQDKIIRDSPSFTGNNSALIILDGRDTYTKLDWITWTASMTNSYNEFSQLITPVYHFLNETPDRVPMTDWYWTKNGDMRGFVACSVVGGVYMELLKDKLINKK